MRIVRAALMALLPFALLALTLYALVQFIVDPASDRWTLTLLACLLVGSTAARIWGPRQP